MVDFAEWLTRRGYSRRTQATYMRSIARLNRWLETRGSTIQKASWEQIRAYGDTLPHTHGSRAQIRSALKAWWRYKERKDCPAWAIDQPRKPEPRWRGIPPLQVRAVLEAARRYGPDRYAAMCLLYYQALRREEAVSLRWSNVGNDELRIIGKGNREHVRDLHPAACEALSHLRRNTPWVFPGRDPHTHLAPATLNLWVRLIGARAGLDHLTPHQMRHSSVATVNDAQGLREAAWFARHSDIRTTMTYTHTGDEKRAAILRSLEPWEASQAR